MRDIPIIFSAPMVCALLDGRKQMTRRLAWQTIYLRMNGALEVRCKERDATHSIVEPSLWQRVKPGDRLWVRESSRSERIVIGGVVRERARYPEDGGPGSLRREFDPMRYKPSIHMPRWASRLTLIVTATKIERLQEISEDDAVAEGCFRSGWTPKTDKLASEMFRGVWEELHGSKSWDANPEVVALTFTVHRCNIDHMPKAEAA